MNFVLDNSVAMRWILESKKSSDQKYAYAVLETLENNNAVVPNLWHLEATNVFLMALKNKQITQARIEQFILQLENLPIKVDFLTAEQAFNRIYPLARFYNLSSHDAAYLELALREGNPIATLDKNLKKAAIKAKVGLYLFDTS